VYEAQLEFPQGWGGVKKESLPQGGMDIFWNYALRSFPCFALCIEHGHPTFFPVMAINLSKALHEKRLV